MFSKFLEEFPTLFFLKLVDKEKVNNSNVPQVISSNNNAKKETHRIYFTSLQNLKNMDLRKTENRVSVTLQDPRKAIMVFTNI